MALAVDDVGARGVEVTRAHQRMFDAILHLFDIDLVQRAKLPLHGVGQRQRCRTTEFASGLTRRGDGAADLVQLERDPPSIALAQHP